jgi:hypothetical protein
MPRYECELSIKKSGEVLGRVTVDYQTVRDGAGWGTSDGEIVHSLPDEQVGKLFTSMTPLILKRGDGRTAEVQITNVPAAGRLSVLFNHAPFPDTPRPKGGQ